MSARTTKRPRTVVVVCLACRTDLAECEHADQAHYLAGVHNDTRHGTGRGAFVVPGPDEAFGGDAA